MPSNPVLDRFPTYGQPPPEVKVTAKDSLSFDERPPTPDTIKQYRSSHHGIGQSRTNIRNISISNDKTWGKQNDIGERSGEVMKSQLRSAVGDTLNQQKESRVYKSTRQPLGRRQITNAKIPEQHQRENFSFGRPTASSESAKNLIFPMDSDANEAEMDPEKRKAVREQYKKTHRDYDVGEQSKRDYKWDLTTVKDPSKFSFGKKVTSNGTVLDCIKPSTLDKNSGFNAEKNIVSNVQQEYNHFNTERLGRTKPTDIPVDPDNTVFGKKNVVDEYDAAACIKGSYSEEEQQPDPDLGKSLRPGYRNQTDDPDRAFGVATIRTDLPKPKVKSITNSQNYGNEPDAKTTIRPSKFANLGISEDDFDTLLSKPNLEELALAADLVADEEEFSDIAEFAQERFADEIEEIRKRDRDFDSNKVCTVDMLRRAVEEIRLAKNNA